MRSLAEINKQSNLIVGLIPARWYSTRFEGKPLAEICGIPMIKRVYDRACMAKTLDTVVVLTDDERISNFCSKHEMRCIVIEDHCRTGTDRCSSALSLLDGKYFVNIQGDEPLINPEAIDKLVEELIVMDEHLDIGIVNAYTDIDQSYKETDKNVVKVAFDSKGCALYYSRLPITDYQQMGLYGFQRKRLEQFRYFDPGPCELKESVEMFRYLENGREIKMVHVEDEGLSVDTPEDLKLVELKIKSYN